jgi:hypothetical protein
MPNPWVSLRCDKLNLVKKVVNVKEQLEKGLEEEGEKKANPFSEVPENRPSIKSGKR